MMMSCDSTPSNHASLCSGCLHPDHQGYFSTPADYMDWYKSHGPLRDNAHAPTVAIMLYRKHVITNQGYIPQLIRTMEEQGVLPVPIFINGVEAHTVVRRLFSFMSAPLSKYVQGRVQRASTPGASVESYAHVVCTLHGCCAHRFGTHTFLSKMAWPDMNECEF